MSKGYTDEAFDMLVDYWYDEALQVNRVSYKQSQIYSILKINRKFQDWFMIIDLHGGPSSAVSSVRKDETSYPHRDAILKCQFYDRINGKPYPEDGFEFLNGWVDAITSVMNRGDYGMYLNYADTSLSTEEAHEMYWLQHYHRLADIKTSVDPRDLFTNPQAVKSWRAL